jgi:hypothetical protein
MTERRTFWWKVGYLVAIAALVVPLNLLSLPATRDSDGGKLAQLRKRFNLSEANLGEIDASAETIKLATLGLRGVAVNLLWERANHCKMIEDWSGFGAALTQIANLQPHFFTVWDYQAHNLSYNTSVEFDDYHDRYHWVMEGIKFLKLGKQYNEHEPRMTARIGWFIGHKMGKSDEHRQFRRLFKEDDNFHNADNPNRERSKRDSWLVSYEYYKKAWQEVNDGDPLRTTPVIFYSQPLMSLIYFADALESDSTAGETPHFGQVAQQAWKHAAEEMKEFVAKDIATWMGTFIHLDAQEDLVAHETDLEKQLQDLLPGEFDKFKADRGPKLTPDEQVSLKTSVDKRNGGQQTTAIEFWSAIAERTPADRRPQARKLVAEFRRTEEALRDIRISRDIVNFTYWKNRCEAERTDAALLARELTFKAGQEQMEARPTAAKKLYEQAFQQWRKVMDQFQVLREDSLTAEDLAEIVERYRNVLRQLAGDESKFPENFILQDILDSNEKTNPTGLVKSSAKSNAKTDKVSPPEKTPANDSPVKDKPATKDAPAPEKKPAPAATAEPPKVAEPPKSSDPAKSPASGTQK